ncbi:MAG: ribosomal L7Ae/L30e/S12e/Gadd45 family protein [Firmicutes bacterium]|nr:ribosomal L7Ae/L30e/S12e/Gadd45 family protein [Bacillota bacterium]
MKTIDSVAEKNLDRKVASFLSICMKAGKIGAGERVCEMSLRNGAARLVILAGDASGNTKKKFEQKTFYYRVPIITIGTKDEISRCIGRENRAVFVVTDEGLAENVMRLIGENGKKGVNA